MNEIINAAAAGIRLVNYAAAVSQFVFLESSSREVSRPAGENRQPSTMPTLNLFSRRETTQYFRADASDFILGVFSEHEKAALGKPVSWLIRRGAGFYAYVLVTATAGSRQDPAGWSCSGC